MGKWKSWSSGGGGRSRMAAVALGLVVSAGAMFVAAPASAQIASTKHNLGTTGTQPNHLTAGTEEICVFCHTPHAATQTDQGGNALRAPLWNRRVPDGAYFHVASVWVASDSTSFISSSFAVTLSQSATKRWMTLGGTGGGWAWARAHGFC